MKNFLQSKAVFWKVKLFWENAVSFNFFKQLYRARFHYREEKTSASILKQSLGSLLLNGLYATFVVAFFEFLYYLSPVKIPLVISKQDLTLLISTVVTVSGVFLGLYFTAVSAVAGNLFMRASEDLQRLFIREKKGQQYIKTLALTMVMGIFYLTLEAFGYSVSSIGPIFIAILAAYVVIRFISLGSRIFYFLHPIEASATVTGDAAYAIQNATVQGFGWEKSYLQNHYREQAEYALKTLQSLIDFGVGVVNLSNEQLVTIVRYAGGLINYYLVRKKHIPTESYWFKTKPQFQNWILADSSEIILALNTGTPLLPKNIKDKTWFEETSIGVVLKLFNYFVGKKEWESAHICLEVLVSVAEKIGPEFYDDTAKLVIEKVDSAVRWIVMEDKELTDAQEIKGRLAIIDSCCGLVITVLIGLLRYLDKRNVNEIEKEIKAVDWDNEIGIYESILPGELLSGLESTVRQYQTEKIIEGKSRSPEWYLITITIQQYLFGLKRYFDYVKSLHDSFFKKNVDSLVKNKQILLAAQLVQRWLEFVNKLRVCGVMVEKVIKDCATLRKVKDLPWVEIDFDKERSQIGSWDKEVIDKLVYLLPILIQQSQLSKGELPDYFGQAYTFGVEACYQACLENDLERFKKIFPIVFLGSLTAHDTTRKQVQGWLQDSQIIFSSEPLEDLLNLSGYAKLYGELYQNADLWKICEDVWNNYLASNNAKDAIGLIVAISQYRDSKFMIMPKAIIRSNWDIKFRQKLQEMNLVTDPFENHLGKGLRTINHPSPIIRVVGRYGDLLPADPRNIFFVTYLSKHQAAKGIEFSDRRNLGQQIERESNPQQSEPTAL